MFNLVFVLIKTSKHAQYAHGVVLTSMRRRFNVMNVVWTSKRRRVLTGRHSIFGNQPKDHR